jgi:hypothetical protein
MSILLNYWMVNESHFFQLLLFQILCFVCDLAEQSKLDAAALNLWNPLMNETERE